MKSKEVGELATVILHSFTDQDSEEKTNDKYELVLVDLVQRKVLGRKPDVTTAVFNETKDAIIAGLDTHENGLAVLKADASLSDLTVINLTFPDLHNEIGVDKFRLLWIQ